jgi:hypothetical protein
MDENTVITFAPDPDPDIESSLFTIEITDYTTINEDLRTVIQRIIRNAKLVIPCPLPSADSTRETNFILRRVFIDIRRSLFRKNLSTAMLKRCYRGASSDLKHRKIDEDLVILNQEIYDYANRE